MSSPTPFYVFEFAQNLLFAVLCLVAAAVSFGSLIALLRHRGCAWDTRKIFYLLLGTTLAARAVLYVLVAAYFYVSQNNIPNALVLCILVVPIGFEFASFSFLFYRLARISRRISSQSLALLSVRLIVINVLFNAANAILSGLSSYDYFLFNPAFVGLCVNMMCLHITVSSMAVSFGMEWMRMIRQLPLGSERKNRETARKTALFVAILVVCSATRLCGYVYLAATVFSDITETLIIVNFLTRQIPELLSAVTVLVWMRKRAGDHARVADNAEKEMELRSRLFAPKSYDQLRSLVGLGGSAAANDDAQ